MRETTNEAAPTIAPETAEESGAREGAAPARGVSGRFERDIAGEMERRKRFLRFTDADAENLARLSTHASRAKKRVTDTFYDHLLRYETKDFIRSKKHVQNLKRVQGEYFSGLFRGEYGAEYGSDRLRVGRTHERIGLGPEWYVGAYALYLCEMLPVVFRAYASDPKAAMATAQSLVKVICLDMGLAIDTYVEAREKREAEQVETFVDALNKYAGSLGATSGGIVGSIANQTAAAQQQASAVQEVTTTISELRHTSQQALEKASAVIEGSERSVEKSSHGSQAVEDAVQGMREIRGQVEAIAEKILSLSEQTQQIGEIIASVNEISEQSKLLALNASIEAARAGEHGKGFSVVATEIRSLADQSKQATAQVRKILSDIQSATNSAVVATEEGTKKVEQGVGLASRAGETIHTLSESIRESAEAAQLIVASARQQTAGIQQVSDAMVSINQATNSAVAGLKQTEDASAQLKQMTEEMNELVDAFSKPKERQVDFRLA